MKFFKNTSKMAGMAYDILIWVGRRSKINPVTLLISQEIIDKKLRR